MTRMTFFLQNEMNARKLITGNYIRERDEDRETTDRVFDLLDKWYDEHKQEQD